MIPYLEVDGMETQCAVSHMTLFSTESLIEPDFMSIDLMDDEGFSRDPSGWGRET